MARFSKTELFGQLLLASGLVTTEQLEEALHKKETTMLHRKIGEILVRLSYLSKTDVAKTLANQFSLEYWGPEKFADIPPEVISRIEGSIATLYRVIPVAEEGDYSLVVATADPEGNEVMNVGVLLKKKIVCVVASPEDIARALSKYYFLCQEEVRSSIFCSLLPPEPGLEERSLSTTSPSVEDRLKRLEERVSRLESQDTFHHGVF